MSFLETIRSLSSRRPPGPARTFTELQVIRAILLLGEKKVLGRTLLSRLLNTGSGAIRTMVNDLEAHSIITVDRSGCLLTEKGLDIYNQIVAKIPVITQVDAGRLSIAKFDAGVIVKGASHLIHHGIEQRDAAVRVGAKGATTLIYKNGRFMIPMGSDDCSRDFPGDIWNRLKETFHPEEDDVIIVDSADEAGLAIYGALAGAITLLEGS